MNESNTASNHKNCGCGCHTSEASHCCCHTHSKNVYDDGDIPKVDHPRNSRYENVEPLPESTRPRKDGPGGEA